MFQGMGKDTDALNREFGFEAAEVDVMILSHAHIDHSGLIPRLFKQGFNGKIFCTDATRELSALLLEDSAEIQENEVKYHNTGSRAQRATLVHALDTIVDAKNCMNNFYTQPYGQWFAVTEGVEAMFTDAGHIIGSTCVHVRVTEAGVMRQLTFSGDVGRYRDVILKSPQTFS